MVCTNVTDAKAFRLRMKFICIEINVEPSCNLPIEKLLTNVRKFIFTFFQLFIHQNETDLFFLT